jgi:phospholipase/lecithinase/hemolysin
MKTITCFIVAWTTSSFSQAALYSDVISFGDSWSDTGNMYSAHGVPYAPFYDGNFSDGLTWTEQLAVQLGLTPTIESELGGFNYAWGGATALEGNSLPIPDIPPIPSLEDQVQEHLVDALGTASPTALYTIWAGVNDKQTDASTANAIASATMVASQTQNLITAGAQHILVLNQPFSAGSYNTAFNSTLDSLLTAISGNVMLLDMQALYTDVEANFGSYGLSSFTEHCGATADTPYGGGTLSENCDTLFRVDITGHHSAKGNQIIAQAAFNTVVPIPAAAWLFVSAFGGLAAIKKMLA